MPESRFTFKDGDFEVIRGNKKDRKKHREPVSVRPKPSGAEVLRAAGLAVIQKAEGETGRPAYLFEYGPLMTPFVFHKIRLDVEPVALGELRCYRLEYFSTEDKDLDPASRCVFNPELGPPGAAPGKDDDYVLGQLYSLSPEILRKVDDFYGVDASGEGEYYSRAALFVNRDRKEPVFAYVYTGKGKVVAK